MKAHAASFILIPQKRKTTPERRFSAPAATLIFLFGLFRLHDDNIGNRGNSGNRMLIHQLLLAVILNYDRKIIKAPDLAPDLETVYQIDHYRQVFFAHMVQETVLQIHHGFIACYICHVLQLSFLDYSLQKTLTHYRKNLIIKLYPDFLIILIQLVS
jgi:hypothetical protein